MTTENMVSYVNADNGTAKTTISLSFLLVAMHARDGECARRAVERGHCRGRQHGGPAHDADREVGDAQSNIGPRIQQEVDRGKAWEQADTR